MSLRRKAILVVDDNVNVANSLVMVLQRSGYNAVAAYHATQVRKLTSGLAVDLALIDVNLPDKDGLKLAVEICSRLTNCKILLMSGDPDSAGILERANADGIAFPVMSKPIPPQELLSTIATLLAQGNRT